MCRFDYQRAQFPEYELWSEFAVYFEIYLDGSSFRRSASLGTSIFPSPAASRGRMVSFAPMAAMGSC